MGYEDEKTAQNFAPTRPNDLVRIPARLLVLNHVLNIGGGKEIRYSGANKYLIHCRFFKVSHLQRMERSVIFIVGTSQDIDS